MVIPADHRAHCIAIAAGLLVDQMRACDVPAETSRKISNLIEQIRGNADALRDELAPHVKERPIYAGNVVPLRRR